MRDLLFCLKSAFRYPGYLPQPVTFLRVMRWLRQFKKEDRKKITQLLDKIIYLSATMVRQALVDQNAALMGNLATAGFTPEQLIYVQVHDAGSSSPVMLNLLRDAAQLEQRGCRFLDSKNSLGLHRLTNQLGQGAIIYVDDFVGTGMQFLDAREHAVQNVVGNFSEFLLVPSICEEGLVQVGRKGIEAYSAHVHSKAERPLHANSTILDASTKKRLLELCDQIDSRTSLGFGGLATMVVLYRNAPDNVPVILRGSEMQSPFVGIFPRTTDLPIRA